MEGRELKVRLKNKSLILNEEDSTFLMSMGIDTFNIKIIPDIDEICKKENISKTSVEKIAEKQRIPLEVALELVRSKGKLRK